MRCIAAVNTQTAQRAAGRMMIVGLKGEAFDADARALLEEVRPSGVVLFARNMPDCDTLTRLTADLLDYDKELLLAIDHEGGRIDRLPAGCTKFPAALTMTKSADPGLIREAARAQAFELRSFGFHINFAPVLDINTNADNPIIGDRAFGTTPEEVAHHAIPYLQGLTEAGLLGCGKHFPGHGDTSLDSHLELPFVELPADRLRTVEMAPFARAIAHNVAMIMTAHVVYQALDRELPASLSSSILDGELRGRLGFSGVIVSDDLEMKAVADHYGIGRSAVLAIGAGSDMVLVCKEPEAIRETRAALADAIADHTIAPATLYAAHVRIDKLLARRRKLARVPVPAGLRGCALHQELAERLA